MKKLPGVFATQLKNLLTKSIYEKYAPAAVLNPDAPNHWQEKVLYLFILVSVSVGFFVYVLGIYGNITHSYWLILLAVTGGYFACLFIFLFPNLPFPVRAGMVCAFIYLIGMSVILTVGPFYASREWLFAFTVIAAVLLGWPGALLSMGINLATWFAIGGLIHIGFWDDIFLRSEGSHYWFMIAIDLLFILVSTTLLITLFFIRIDESDRAAKSYSQLLLNERNKLSESNERLAREMEDRRAVSLALEKSEEKYRTILETIEDGYHEVDLRGNLIFFNRAFAGYLGYGDEELLSMSYRAFMDQQNAQRIYKVYNTVFSTGKPSLPTDVEVIPLNRGPRTLSVVASLIIDGQGNPVGFRGLARDITQHKQMENRLQQARKMEALGTLAGGVAHDLNNTLSGIVSYPELLLLNMAPTDPLRKPITDMMKSGEKAAAIVQDMLALARRGVAVKEIINLNDLIREYLASTEFMTLQTYHANVRFETRLEKSLLNLCGSPVHLSKTLMNLVINAAEAIENSGTVTIATENLYIENSHADPETPQEVDYVTLSVRDTGKGIPPDDLDKIFEPFFTKKSMGRSGTGLGMAVVWGTVEDHGGRIDVQSAEGQGTTFSLHFPATRKAAARKDNPAPWESIRGRGERILIVDDIETQRQVAGEILSALGYSPIAVKSGEEAVDYIQTHPVDLILLDMIMRDGIDGLETYRRIIELRPGQKAIIASGFSETERVYEAQALGAGAYLKKPYSIEKLGLAIKRELSSNG